MDENNHDPLKKMMNGLKAAGIALGAISSAAAAGYYYLVRRPMARQEGELRLPGLKGPVQVLRDKWGVPHIYANSEFDMFFAQGFVHAQDRLWQMEFNRRVVAGRLSELLGEVTVDLDRWIRVLHLRRAAEQELEVVDQRTLYDLQAYAAGVNARIEQGRLPMEFTLLRHEPELWTVVDSIGWTKMMAWTLSGNWESELLRSKLIAKLGEEKAAELDFAYLDRWGTTIPSGVDYSDMGVSALERAEQARPILGPQASSGLGSNNWAVAGSRTASGRPMFANDMHLPMDLPSIWYENHLSAPGINVTGVSFPGLPGIIAGHNGHVAWGYTNGFSDTQDLYMERIRRLEDGRVQYEYQGVWHDAEVITEEIQVRGGETVTEEVVVTRHGPLINNMVEEEQPIALRWVSLETEGMVNTLHPMIRAKNCQEFRESLRSWSTPTQNVVYADTEGNIGFTHAGKVPVRNGWNGKLPVPGWSGEYEWDGFIPYEEMPHMMNPEKGFIATANNPVVDDGYPHNLGLDHVIGDRAQRIGEMIMEAEVVDAEVIRRMHKDLISTPARVIKGYIGELQLADPELDALVKIIRIWDGGMRADSAAAAIYQLFMRHLLTTLLEPKLEELTIRYAGKGPIPGLAEGSMFGFSAWVWLENLLGQPESHWYDLGNGEDRTTVVAMALRKAHDYLAEELGPDPERWRWGQIHTLTFSHVLGRTTPLGAVLNRGPYPLDGDGTTVCMGLATVYDLSNPVIIGPPFRFIADMGDLRNSMSCLVPGQSGQPSSEHYDDQIDDWHKGEYHPVLYEREDVERELKHRLKLFPA